MQDKQAENTRVLAKPCSQRSFVSSLPTGEAQRSLLLEKWNGDVIGNVVPWVHEHYSNDQSPKLNCLFVHLIVFALFRSYLMAVLPDSVHLAHAREI